jgi:hypothetical protein
MAEMLLEFCDSRGVKLAVNRESGVIEGVKVLGLMSKNGRSYLKETVARAASLYEGVRVNVNHPNGNPNQPRDYRDRMGTIRNVRVEQGDGGLRADFHFNPKHALAEQLIWDAEHAPENVGFSHNVEARVSRKGDKVIVEEISRVQSVDLVADPATTRGLFEQDETPIRKESTLEWNDITEATLAANRPEVVKAIADKVLAEHAESEAVKAKDAEMKTLREQVATLTAANEAAALATAVDKMLAEAKMPATAVTDVFKGQLLEAKDDAARKVLIEDRRKLVAGSKPVSKEQLVTEGSDNATGITDAKSFAAALKRKERN